MAKDSVSKLVPVLLVTLTPGHVDFVKMVLGVICLVICPVLVCMFHFFFQAEQQFSKSDIHGGLSGQYNIT